MGLTIEQRAFIVVCGAGASTILGAMVVFSNRLVSLANKTFLASVLAIACGVMIFVAMIEIFVKSNLGFSDYGYSKSTSYALATVCFFGGVLFYQIIDQTVHLLSNYANRNNEGGINIMDDEAMMDMAVKIAEEGKIKKIKEDGETEVKPPINVHMGMMVAIAIAIHNFPEGLATFVGTIADPNVGAALAIAIGIHHIPEGLCVALPIFYATGSRWKAFGFSLICGITGPIGAGFGWVVLQDNFDDRAYGIVFGLVSGMVTIICLQELLPNAHRFDPEDKVTTKSLIFGMAIMAASLVLFVY
mmetsp:Transcript_5233/g.7870  ORF Transcript_5233/g.7870 Transcript_5233/m.7870 type:complete len:302 (+) Transcript_5233:224-1129(+)